MTLAIAFGQTVLLLLIIAVVVGVARLATRDLRRGEWRFVDDDTRRMQHELRRNHK